MAEGMIKERESLIQEFWIDPDSAQFYREYFVTGQRSARSGVLGLAMVTLTTYRFPNRPVIRARRKSWRAARLCALGRDAHAAGRELLPGIKRI